MPAFALNQTLSSTDVHASMPWRIERALLLALAFVLPLFEAPKNLLCIAFLLIWVVNRARARDFGGRWDSWDTLIALWIASGFAVAMFAGIHDDEFRAAADIPRYASVLWVLRRSRYPEKTWISLLVAIVGGTVVALAWGYYGLLVTKERYSLGLHSVGHVNHSAMYLAVVFGVALMATRGWWNTMAHARRLLCLALLALLVVSLVWMESRGAVGAAFIAGLAVLSGYAIRRRRHLGKIALAAALVVGAALLAKPQVVEKNVQFTSRGNVLNTRDSIWRVGLAAWREFPLFGVGMDNFGRISQADLEAWSAKRGAALDKDSVFFASHGHSLFVTALAERGVVGLGVLVAVLVAWAVSLLRCIPAGGAPPLLWAYWGSAAAAWLITVVAGMFNTTLHHEQALLCMLVLGGWLSLSRAQPQASSS